MRRLLLALLLIASLASPAWACQYGTGGQPTVGLSPVNSQTLSVTSSAVGFTLPTTWAIDSSAFNGKIYEAVVYVTGGVVNLYDNGNTPTTSATAGGAPYGSGAAGGTVADICGISAVSQARVISQSGTATLVILYYGR